MDARNEIEITPEMTAPISGSKSIFAHPFYGPLLAAGSIPGEERVRQDILQAVAVLIGRATDSSVDPTLCRGVVALVALANLDKGFPFASSVVHGSDAQPKETFAPRSQSNLVVVE